MTTRGPPVGWKEGEQNQQYRGGDWAVDGTTICGRRASGVSSSLLSPTPAMDPFNSEQYGDKEAEKDVESAQDYKNTNAETSDSEHAALLTGTKHHEDDPLPHSRRTSRLRSLWNTRATAGVAFLVGVVSCILVQLLICAARHETCTPALHQGSSQDDVEIYAPPYAGSSEVHHYPPANPTNVFPSLFPTDVGHAGPTPTGAEPALIATAPAYPLHSGAPHLVSPYAAKQNASSATFDIFRHWGNLSPWFSVQRGAFGLDSSPEAPETCAITGLHLLHRHGARYPTQYGKMCVYLIQQTLLNVICSFLRRPGQFLCSAQQGRRWVECVR